jgi:hypothetical protein
MVPIKKLRSLLLLCIFLILIANPGLWRIAGFTPELSDYSDVDTDVVPDLNADLGFIFRLLCFIVHIGIYKTIFGGFVASIVYFIYRSKAYKDSSVDKMRWDPRAPPALKNWRKVPNTIIPQYLAILILCILWAIVFVLGLLFDVLPEGFYMKVFTLGSVMAIVNTVPIYLKMWIEATYPNKLLAIGFAKGVVGNYILGFTLTYMIWDLPFGKELTICNCIGDLFPFSMFCS